MQASGYHLDVLSFMAGVRATAARTIQLLLALMGAQEDLGMSLSSTSFVPVEQGKRRRAASHFHGSHACEFCVRVLALM
jgi:hypothetical protein